MKFISTEELKGMADLFRLLRTTGDEDRIKSRGPSLVGPTAGEARIKFYFIIKNSDSAIFLMWPRMLVPP